MTNDIDTLIQRLQAYKEKYGNMKVEITDGYHGHGFDIYTEDRGGWDNPTRLLLRPLNQDGKHHTSGILERVV